MYSWLLENLALPGLCSVSSSRFWRAHQMMLELEQSPLEQLQQIQWTRFKELLDFAYARVPFHRERLKAANVTPDDVATPADLHRIPVSTKTEIQRNFPDLVCAEGADQSDWQYASTSGTS